MKVQLDQLKDALNNNDFFLEYQPIMQIDGKVCVGVETLIRWNKDNQTIYPSNFIPIIENTPLSGLITYWIIEQVNQDLSSWLHNNPGVFVSINIPPEILGRGGLSYVVSKCGLVNVSNQLIMEVTERGLPDNLGIKGIIEGKKSGFKVCLDDVGATDENLLVYARASFDYLKLDQSLAAKMLEPNWTIDKIGALEAFTKSTPIKVIAEGIETKVQRDIYKELGVQLAQGWFFSYPLSLDALFEFLQNKELNTI